MEASGEAETMGVRAEEIGLAEEEHPKQTKMRDHVHRPSLDVPARYGVRLVGPSHPNSLGGMSLSGVVRVTVGCSCISPSLVSWEHPLLVPTLTLCTSW